MKIVSVTQLTNHIKALIEGSALLDGLWLTGEVSNFKRHISGHCYLTLKDSGAAIRAVMFKSRADALRFEPQNGMKVLVAGRVSVYERDGAYQFYIDRMLPDGVGELWLQVEQLRDKLRHEGLFDRKRQRLPLLPKRVCVITSPTGAVIRDIVTVATKRTPYVQVVLFPSVVQGKDAPVDISNAIVRVNQEQFADLIIIARGGGSLEDLMAFNDERLIRAVAASRIPVISAVGHETDFTLCDAVADVRAATPSQAAEIAIPDARVMHDALIGQCHRATLALGNDFARRRTSIKEIVARRVFVRPLNWLDRRKQDSDRGIEQLERAMAGYSTHKRAVLEGGIGKLVALNPLAVFARGFALVSDVRGRTVRSARVVQRTDCLEIRFADGCVHTLVTAVSGEYDEEKK